MEGTAKADYTRCVDICTKAAQREMILSSLLALLAPIVVGLLFNVDAVVGLLVGVLASGFVMAVMMANAGGAWDNAKKYVERGAHGERARMRIRRWWSAIRSETPSRIPQGQALIY